jgi:anti-sigma factor RsiW
MACERTELLSAFFDGELLPGEAAEVEKHFQDCAECTAAHSALVDTSSRIRASLMRYEAPDVLKARIRAELNERARESSEHVNDMPARNRSSAPRRFVWSGIAAAAAIAVISSASTIAVMHRRGTEASVANDVLTSHIRSLMPGHLTDVASNDQHNVKPWFNGRVDVSPDVPRLDSLGYPLLGGRVDYIGGKRVATVVYGRRQHVINVFEWPSSEGGEAQPSVSRANGYNLIRMRHNGIELWTVSDLNLAELRGFLRMMTPTN